MEFHDKISEEGVREVLKAKLQDYAAIPNGWGMFPQPFQT